MTAFDPARIDLPPEDRTLSPITGWTRNHWAAVADHLLLSLRPYFSSSRSRVQLPGIVSSHGTASDGLEGFARSFMLYAFRLHGDGGDDPYDFTEWYRSGLAAGCDPANPERWPRPSDVGQAKVEAASIALGLQLTRPWLWDRLGESEQRNVIAWLADAPDGWYPDNNWLWFRITVETFLASVGGPHDPERIRQDLATIESYYRTDGWYADGPLRAFDYYCGWAMHLYPLLWTDSAGADAFGARALEPVFRSRLTDFLDDHAALIGADGMPVLQGRSLIYRFAAAAPLWMGAVTGATRLPAGTLRRAAPAPAPLPGSVWLPSVQVLVCRGRAGDPTGLALAAKGGTNDENHNHKDLGSFIVTAGGRPLLIDIGKPTYTRATFSAERYRIRAMQSGWHNAPAPRGLEQGEGPAFVAQVLDAPHGEPGDASTPPGAPDLPNSLELDLSRAYPLDADEHWRRRVSLVSPTRDEVHDDWHVAGGAVVHLIAAGDVRRDGARVIVAADGHAIAIDAGGIAPEVEEWPLDDPELTRVWGASLTRLSYPLGSAAGTLTTTIEEIR